MGEDWYLFGYGYLYPTVQKGLFFFPFCKLHQQETDNITLSFSDLVAPDL